MQFFQHFASILLVFTGTICLSSVTSHCVAAEPPHIVVVVGTWHYSPDRSMPLFAEELRRLGFRVTLVMGDGNPEKKTENVLPGINSLADADAAILFLRFLQLGDQEWQAIHAYLESGKPVIGLRTTSHAFKYPNDHHRAQWNDGFGKRVLATPYIVHQSGSTDIRMVEKNQSHPILSGLQQKQWVSPGSLYLTRLEPGCTPLLIGKGTGRSRLVEKSFGTIQVNETESDVVAWTWTNEWGGNTFATSLGHPGDFANESFVRMLVNSVHWAVDLPVPDGDTPINTWQVKMIKHNKSKPNKPRVK